VLPAHLTRALPSAEQVNVVSEAFAPHPTCASGVCASGVRASGGAPPSGDGCASGRGSDPSEPEPTRELSPDCAPASLSGVLSLLWLEQARMHVARVRTMGRVMGDGCSANCVPPHLPQAHVNFASVPPVRREPSRWIAKARELC
jgi:hypothetical protein